MTINLSTNETTTYAGAARAYLLDYARRTARRMNRRYAQLVATDGRILDVIEVDLLDNRAS